MSASRVTLVSSTGTPHRSGLPLLVYYGQPSGRGGGPPSIAVPASQTYWSCARRRTSPRSQWPLLYDPSHVGKRTVYAQLHCHSGFSPLHSVLGVGVFRISLCVLCTQDHVTWSPTLYQKERSLPRTPAPPLNRSFLPVSYEVSGS